MSVTQTGQSLVMTALDDTYAGPIFVHSIALVGKSMTTDQRLTITNNNGGVVADHYVENATENVELCPNPQWFPGLKLTAVPAAGTWTVVVKFA